MKSCHFTWPHAYSPKRGRLNLACLVHEMMEEIPVLRYKSQRRWTRVVGAENGTDFVVAIKNRPDAYDCVVGYDDVSIYEEQDLPPRMSSAMISRGGGAGVSG